MQNWNFLVILSHVRLYSVKHKSTVQTTDKFLGHFFDRWLGLGS